MAMTDEERADRTCATCVHYKKVPKPPNDARDLGECRRFPPVPVQLKIDTVQTRWPYTEEKDWCGEWAGA